VFEITSENEKTRIDVEQIEDFNIRWKEHDKDKIEKAHKRKKAQRHNRLRLIILPGKERKSEAPILIPNPELNVKEQKSLRF